MLCQKIKPQLKLPKSTYVHLKDGRLVTDSMTVAQVFGKQHKNVIRDIEALECSEEFTRSNFGLSAYSDPSGKRNKMYEITRDGFMFLVTGFTGRVAG